MGPVGSRVLVLETVAEALNLHRMDGRGHGQDLHNSHSRVPGASERLDGAGAHP